jgi:hypothetical protein
VRRLIETGSACNAGAAQNGAMVDVAVVRAVSDLLPRLGESATPMLVACLADSGYRYDVMYNAVTALSGTLPAGATIPPEVTAAQQRAKAGGTWVIQGAFDRFLAAHGVAVKSKPTGEKDDEE